MFGDTFDGQTQRVRLIVEKETTTTKNVITEACVIFTKEAEGLISHVKERKGNFHIGNGEANMRYENWVQCQNILAPEVQSRIYIPGSNHVMYNVSGSLYR